MREVVVSGEFDLLIHILSFTPQPTKSLLFFLLKLPVLKNEHDRSVTRVSAFEAVSEEVLSQALEHERNYIRVCNKPFRRSRCRHCDSHEAEVSHMVDQHQIARPLATDWVYPYDRSYFGGILTL